MSDLPPGTAPVEPAAPSGDTGNGFLVGVDPSQGQQNVDWQGANAPTGSPQAAPPPAPPQPQQQQRVYTEEDLNRVRQEEKSKLYGRIDEMGEQLKALTKEREEREAQEKAAREAAEAEAKRQEEEALDARQLAERVRQETNERLAQIEQERAQERAVFEKEREFARLQDYQRERISQESEHIMPELRDLIGGSSEAEIDAAIEVAKQKTQAIMAQVTGRQQQVRQEMQGVSPTAPPVGPMEQQTTIETLSPQDIATMDMETYKQHRGSLLAATSRAYGGR